MSKQDKKELPDFADEAEEVRFWEAADSTDYLDWEQARPAHFDQLKPSTKTISLRLPEMLLADIKAMAHKRDVPYQSLMKLMLSEAVKQHSSPR